MPGRGILDAADDYLRRLAVGLAVSLFLHVAFLVAVWFLFVGEKPGGGDSITIEVGPASPANTDSDEIHDRLADATQKVEPAPREEDQPSPEVDVEERARRIEESLEASEEREVQEFGDLQTQAEAERVAGREARIAGMRDLDEEVSGNVERRGGLKGLEPRTFFGLKIHTRRVVFVLDISGSMDIEFAKLNLRNAYRDLEADAHFGIILYNANVDAWKDHLVRATPEAKAEADEFLSGVTNFGATNIYGALRRAFEVSESSIVQADTVYFLTDGLPNAGDVTDPDGILAAVRRWNGKERVVIHAIHVLGPMSSYDPQQIEVARYFMKRLAQQNSGVYVERQ